MCSSVVSVAGVKRESAELVMANTCHFLSRLATTWSKPKIALQITLRLVLFVLNRRRGLLRVTKSHPAWLAARQKPLNYRTQSLERARFLCRATFCREQISSVRVQKQDLLDQLVGTNEERQRYFKSKGLGSLEVHDQFDLGGLFDREIT
jgi:hypothetical protein